MAKKNKNAKAQASEAEKETAQAEQPETENAAPNDENPLEAELDKTKEQLLRITAEYANFRKRSEKEKGETYALAAAKTVEAFLSVADNLERAVASEQEDYEGLKKGVQMTYDGLMAVFSKLGVTVFGKAGEAFNPTLHNAVMHIEDDSLDENVITDVFQKGYKMQEKIIRPAMVKTAN